MAKYKNFQEKEDAALEETHEFLKKNKKLTDAFVKDNYLGLRQFLRFDIAGAENTVGDNSYECVEEVTRFAECCFGRGLKALDALARYYFDCSYDKRVKWEIADRLEQFGKLNLAK